MATELRVATCGDCIHADVCEHNPNIPLFNRANAAYCKSFKDRTKYVEVADMREFAEEVVYQYGYYGQYEGRLHIGHGGLSTLEHAFDILGWDSPHPVPECECEIEGCHEHATCGAPTSNGYKRMCTSHYGERRKENRCREY